MASAFASALEALFADAHLASDIVYIAEGGAPSLVRAILRRPDDVTRRQNRWTRSGYRHGSAGPTAWQPPGARHRRHRHRW